MDKGAWQATTHRVTKSRHNLVPEKQQQSRPLNTYTLLDATNPLERIHL